MYEAKEKELEFFEHDQHYDLLHKSPFPVGILTERGYGQFIGEKKNPQPNNQNKTNKSKCTGVLCPISKGCQHHKCREGYLGSLQIIKGGKHMTAIKLQAYYRPSKMVDRQMVPFLSR